MHEIRLHPTLEPAGALIKPNAGIGWRFFPSCRCQDANPFVEAREAHTKIGILSHVEGIPRACLLKRLAAEMIRRAA